ncbi:Gag-Pol poly, partial [Haematococcus lacustris]
MWHQQQLELISKLPRPGIGRFSLPTASAAARPAAPATASATARPATPATASATARPAATASAAARPAAPATASATARPAAPAATSTAARLAAPVTAPIAARPAAAPTVHPSEPMPATPDSRPTSPEAPGAPLPRRNPPRDRRLPLKLRQHDLFAMTVSDSPINDTPTVAEALAGPMADLWIEAMNAELASLHANQTWCLEECPANARVLPTKWVLKVKRDAAGNIEKLKARLVAKGFYQQSVYVDDCLLCTQQGDTAGLAYVKKQLSSAFKLKDLGEARWFLGMQLTRDRAEGTIKLDQHKFIQELVTAHSKSAAHSKPLPMAPAVKLVREGDALDTTLHHYSALVGSLLYLTCCTRPDIAFAVGALARHMSAPTKQHGLAACSVLCYLKGTADQGLLFGGVSGLQGYTDADYAGDKDTAMSTTVVRCACQTSEWEC